MITQTTMQKSFILLLFVLFLAACGGETAVEPTPILPPPNITVGDADGNATGTINTEDVPVAEADVATPLPPTPTLEPTATLPATAVSLAITNPPTVKITRGLLPPTSRDLLFLADGAFKRWSAQMQAIEILVPGADPATRIRTNENRGDDFVGDITAYSVSEDGKRAVFARLTFTQPITRTYTLEGSDAVSEFVDEERQTELYFMDLVSKETWLLVPRVDNLGEFSLANNGQTVAFAGGSLDGNLAFNEYARYISNIYFLPTGGGNPGAMTQVAACDGSCSPIVWHPENNLFVYGDNVALWMQNSAANAPELLLQNQSSAPEGGTIADVAIYTPISWARNGRFLLMWRTGFERASRALFDVPTQAVVDVPDTVAGFNAFAAEVMWMPDDCLYVLRSESQDDPRPQIELWRFQPEQNNLVKEEALLLSESPMGATGQQYLQNGRFAYALMSDQEINSASGTFHLTSLNETPERVNAVPIVGFYPGGGGQVLWPTDGSGALIVMDDNSGLVYYGPASGDGLYEISAMLGADVDAFRWQPEIILP